VQGSLGFGRPGAEEHAATTGDASGRVKREPVAIGARSAKARASQGPATSTMRSSSSAEPFAHVSKHGAAVMKDDGGFARSCRSNCDFRRRHGGIVSPKLSKCTIKQPRETGFMFEVTVEDTFAPGITCATIKASAKIARPQLQNSRDPGGRGA